MPSMPSPPAKAPSSLALRTPAPLSAVGPSTAASTTAPRHPLQQHTSSGGPPSAHHSLPSLALALAHPSFASGALFASPSNSNMATPPRSHPHPDHNHQYIHPVPPAAGGSNASSSSAQAHLAANTHHPSYDSHPHHHHAHLDGSAHHRHHQQQQQQQDSMSDGGSFDGRDGRGQSVEMDAKSPEPGRFVGDASQRTANSTQHVVPGLVASKLPPRKRKRLTRACDTCRKRKIRCDGKHPCGPCVAYESACSYDDTIKKRGPRGGPRSSKSASLPPEGTDTSRPVKQRKIASASRKGPASLVLSDAGPEGAGHHYYAGDDQSPATWSTHGGGPGFARSRLSGPDYYVSDHGSGRYHHLHPQAPSIQSSPGIAGGRHGPGSAADWYPDHSGVYNGVRPPPSQFVQSRHDLPPPPFPVLSTVRTAVQLFSKLAVSALAPDSLRKWCASQPFDAPAWQPTQVPDHVEPHMQRSMSFALGLAITVFVYRTCGPESLLAARGTPQSTGNGSSSTRTVPPPATIDEVRIADWMTTTVGVAMHAPCAMDPELGSGDCHFARALSMYLLAYSELTAGNVPSARRLCLAALDVLQEEAAGSPSGSPSLPTVFQKCEVYLSVSSLYHTLSVAAHVPGGRSSELVSEYERILLSDPAASAATMAGGLGGGVSSTVHLDLVSLIARAVDMSSAPRDRVHPDDRLSLLHSLQAVMVTLEAEDPFPPDEPARFAPALFVRIQSYAILIQLARPAILESLGVAADGTRLPSHAAAPPRAPTLDATLTYATAGLVRLSRWIASQSIDVNPFLQHSFIAATHAIEPAILQATSGVAMMIAGSGRDAQGEARAAEMHHHRGAAHSLLGILHTVSSLQPSPVNIVHRLIAPVSQFCARLDASANPDVIPFIMGVERDHGFGSSLLSTVVPPSAAMHGGGPLVLPPPPPPPHSGTPGWPTYPGQASRLPPPPPPMSHHHPPHAQQLHHHHPPPQSHSHHAHAPPHVQQYPHPRPLAALPPTPPNAPSSHSGPSNPSTPLGRIDGSVPTTASVSAAAGSNARHTSARVDS